MDAELSPFVTKTEVFECQHVRAKKRRRGKKKKSKNPDDFELATENLSEKDESTTVPEDKMKHKKPLIRPVDVPKAPLNYTQFIMDDHDECHLYFSFETPEPYQYVIAKKKNGIAGATMEDAAIKDIDYEYQSPQDLDNSAYYLQDFEDSYFNMRCEEVWRLSREELVSAVENLENRLNSLENRLYEQDPRSALKQLQQKLLLLQDENAVLHRNNEHLEGLLKNDNESHCELSGKTGNSESDEHCHEVLCTGSEQSGGSSDESFDSSDCNDDSFIPSVNVHNYEAREFEHVAIEQSSDDSFSDQIRSAKNDVEATIFCESSPGTPISLDMAELKQDLPKQLETNTFEN